MKENNIFTKFLKTIRIIKDNETKTYSAILWEQRNTSGNKFAYKKSTYNKYRSQIKISLIYYDNWLSMSV